MSHQESSILPALGRQVTIVRALMIREIMTRFGRDNLGFGWVIIEPMMLCLGVMVIWTTLFGSEKHGVLLFEAAYLCYMPLTMWRMMTTSVMKIFSRNSALFLHRSISLFDMLFSKLLLEFVATTTAAVVVWLLLAMLQLVGLPARFELLILGWLSMAILSAGVGTLIAVATERWETVEKFIPPIQYFMLPISAAFFLLDWVPEKARYYLLFNPMVSCFEMIRGGFWGPRVPTYFYAWYPGLFGALLLIWGVYAVSKVRDHIQLQ